MKSDKESVESPVKSSRRDFRKIGKEILRRNKALKAKHDPNRFVGEGVNFKAKIIGIEQVFDARGNRMCQGALQRLKSAAKSSGDHKLRVLLNISLKGIIIKDEKSGDMLHHHPIHKISFISQDSGDNRAFGYVFGCPQSGHEFFGLKTEKVASQVVLTLRDLFMSALEIKKKEIASVMESQSDEQNTVTSNGIKPTEVANGSSQPMRDLHHELLYTNTVCLPETPTAVDTLLDLQYSVDTLQEGISHMDNSIAASILKIAKPTMSEEDVSETSSNSLPMAYHFKLDQLYQETMSVSSRSSSTSDYTFDFKSEDISRFDFPPIASENAAAASRFPLTFPGSVATPPGKLDLNLDNSVDRLNKAGSSSYQSTSDTSPSIKSASSPKSKPEDSPTKSKDPTPVKTVDRYAVFLNMDEMPSIFDNPNAVKLSPLLSEVSECFESVSERLETVKEIANEPEEEPLQQEPEVKPSTKVVFAELDPLGRQTYVDRKDFFQDIKNPPKKILKDLSENENTFPSTLDNSAESFSNSSDFFPDSNDFDKNCESVQISNQFNPFKSGVSAPPELAENICCDSKDNSGGKNPFNPFVNEEGDVPPPTSPPPPPPRLLATNSPPPPRPPNRPPNIQSYQQPVTPPLPKRKSPFAAANQSWFNFDQEALASKGYEEGFESASIPPEIPAFPRQLQDRSGESWCAFGQDSFPVKEWTEHTPPLPSPARKLPPITRADSKNSSASSSPASTRRSFEPPYKHPFPHSPLRVQNSSEVYAFPSQVPPELRSNSSPPLPPKSGILSRPRPSPSKKFFNSNSSSSGVSAFESSNGTHSSSSLAFSSSYEAKNRSSGEVLVSEESDVFPKEDLFSNGKVSPQKPPEVAQPVTSRSDLPEKKSQQKNKATSRNFGSEAMCFDNPVEDEFSKSESSCFKKEKPSPDNIFRRKSDPFADEFFLTLPKKKHNKDLVSKV